MIISNQVSDKDVSYKMQLKLDNKLRFLKILGRGGGEGAPISETFSFCSNFQLEFQKDVYRKFHQNRMINEDF